MQTFFEVEYDYDFDLYGVTCPLKEHKLAWQMEKALDFAFLPKEEFELDFLKDGKLVVSNYLFEGENAWMRLIRNKAWESEKISPYLIPELKQFDYLLMIHEWVLDMKPKELLDVIRSIPNVLLLKQVTIEELKSKENLIFE